MYRSALILATSALVVSAASGQAASIDTVMCQQFSIDGATKTVTPVSQLDQVFATAHHAPRNIPIEVELPGSAVAYIHFPIVEAGQYLIFATDPARLKSVKLKDGSSIETSDAAAPQSCADTLPGGLLVNLGDDKVTGPTPIAIEFAAGPAEEIRLIISRDPID